MANIILINDQDQEQTLTGVSKLVTRGTDGDVEFSLGGGGAVSGGKTIIYALPGGPGQISASTEDSSSGDAEYSHNLGTLLDGKLKIETTAVGRDYNADWTSGANSQDVSGYVGSIREGANFNSNTSKAKITNVSGSDFKLTFNWSANSYDEYNHTTTAIGTVAVEKNTALYSDTLEGGFNGILAAGESVIVSITSATVNTNHDCPVMNITLTDFTAENVAHSVKLTASPYGAYTVQTGGGIAKTVSKADENGKFTFDNKEYNINEPASLPTFQFQSADGIVVTTAADSNHRFYLWQTEKDGRSEVLIPETVDSSTVIRPEYGTILSPVFVETTVLPMFRVDSTDYYYWDDAIQAALKSQSKTVEVYAYTFPKTESEAGRYGTYAIADADGAMNYTIPTGVTLSIRNRLTIPSGVVLQAHGSSAWLTVNAKIQVSKT